MRIAILSILTFVSVVCLANTSIDSSRILVLQQSIAALDGPEDHCEVPCGIYGDSLRIALIDEHIRTIEKATNKINELSNEDRPNYNQLVRWINNKEKHAEEIQQIVSQYFLHQRIKIVDSSNKKAVKKYHKLLTHLHHILVYSMKTKQGTDMENIAKLKQAVEMFDDAYFHTHSH